MKKLKNLLFECVDNKNRLQIQNRRANFVEFDSTYIVTTWFSEHKLTKGSMIWGLLGQSVLEKVPKYFHNTHLKAFYM